MAEFVSGDQRMVDLGNEISDAIAAAVARGLDLDIACSVAACVLADYWVQQYTPASAAKLGNVITDRARDKTASPDPEPGNG